MEKLGISPETFWALTETMLAFTAVSGERRIRYLTGILAIVMPVFLLGAGWAGNKPEVVNVAGSEVMGLLVGAFLGGIARASKN